MKEAIHRINESKEYFFEEGCFILELSNSPDDPAVSVARARVKSGQNTRLHQLSGIIERYVILEGEGIVEIGKQKPQPVKPGDVVIIPADCPQKISNSGKTDLVFLAICTPRFIKEAYLDIEDL